MNATQPPPAVRSHDFFASRMVRKLWSEDTVGCPRCNLMPVQYRAGLCKPDGSWITGKLWFQCPGCGLRGRKAESHDESARLWNERVVQSGPSPLLVRKSYWDANHAAVV